MRIWEFDERLKIYPAEEKAFLKCIFPWNNRLFSPHPRPSFAWKYHCNSAREFHKQSPQNNQASKQSAICTYAKRYDVKECATHGVYWVNLKFKDHNSIKASLYTYLCICMLMGVFCDRLNLCSTAALNCRTGQTKSRYCKKEISFLLVLLYISWAVRLGLISQQFTWVSNICWYWQVLISLKRTRLQQMLNIYVNFSFCHRTKMNVLYSIKESSKLSHPDSCTLLKLFRHNLIWAHQLHPLLIRLCFVQYSSPPPIWSPT